MTVLAIIRRKQTNNGEAGRVARTVRADARAAELTPVIVELQGAGATSLCAVALALNARGIPAPTGRGIWQPWQVRRLLLRIRERSGRTARAKTPRPALTNNKPENSLSARLPGR
jgi:hypothetical protein